MKRLTAILLTLVLASLLFACDKPCTEHVDDDGDGVCDTPGCYEGLKPGGDGGSATPPDFDGGGVETPIIPIQPEY